MAEIQKYYDTLAPTYDTDRFGNTYGAYLHSQEQRILADWLGDPGAGQVLSLGCGTGRFMEYATHGVDLSPQMIKEARRKYPGKAFTVSDGSRTSYPDAFFDAIFALHLVMHLEAEGTSAILSECRRILSPGGRLILDFPSRTRRRLTAHHQDGWHGAQAFSAREFLQLARPGWRLERQQGVLFLPIHRIPARWRPRLINLDNRLCRSSLLDYASYLFIQLRKL